MFSRRIAWSLEPNEFAKMLAAKRAAGVRLLDLTESNPTRAGFDYPPAIVEALADARALVYEPSPCGLDSARAAVAALHGVGKERVLLTASTSESYSYLFKLLCNPGDRVLAPKPSYPLFEFLAALDAVEIAQYPLRYNGAWRIDFEALAASITPRTRAILLVDPNNPTGSFVQPEEKAQLAALCARHGLALVSDEVFAGYALEDRQPDGGWAEIEERTLVFRLNGLSKMAGLPQMKAGWIVIGGPEELRREACERLELIADTFLSVSTPVQHALPGLLAAGNSVREQIRRRTRENLDFLRRRLAPLRVEGGWYAIVPAPTEEYAAVMTLLEQDDVITQPGFFYDFDGGDWLVLSLLSRPEDFSEGVLRLLKRFRDVPAASTPSFRAPPSGL